MYIYCISTKCILGYGDKDFISALLRNANVRPKVKIITDRLFPLLKFTTSNDGVLIQSQKLSKSKLQFA